MKKISKYLTVFCILLFCFLFLGACSALQPEKNSESDPVPENAVEEAQEDSVKEESEDETPDEVAEVPKLPQDDGIPLSFAERAAFRSTGSLDLGLGQEEMQLVERHFKYYLHDQRKTFERYLRRSEIFLPYVRKVFTDKGIPEEIAYLAVVESGFNPNAVSMAGATGMWQFMRFTGLHYGLEQNAWIDERRDPYKSTVAAANYLKWLHEQFGDWLLAVAAYNAGEGKIKKALRSTGARDFFELCRLNGSIPLRGVRLKPETRQYVPRLLAVIKIMRNLETLELYAPDEGKAQEVFPLEVGPGTDLGALAKNAGLRWDEFKELNPAYRRHISPTWTSSTAYVPGGNSKKALAWLSGKASSRFAGWKQYRIRRGDNLHSLGSRYGVSVDVLRQANNLKGNLLREGSALLVPGTEAFPRTARKKTPPPALISALNSYTVQPGDSLYSIARAHGISIDLLQQANKMRYNETRLFAGQKLGIPEISVRGDAGADAGGSETADVLVVRRGDTLYGIAARNNTSVDELARLNGLHIGKPILPGQTLKLP
ncbi:MAG: LysM peptidoglycan-binding domain-containing protein [Deltaproteobacteria bacterium]|jgi:membrane-bound lytic murein transglycosylase D|nr:LysM peptidoglycan-binding domain-containing protein [Deltaproteobacteria bacterium]